MDDAPQPLVSASAAFSAVSIGMRRQAAAHRVPRRDRLPVGSHRKLSPLMMSIVVEGPHTSSTRPDRGA